MAKFQAILLNLIAVLCIVILMQAENSYHEVNTNLLALLVLSLTAFSVISIISIFLSAKMVKQKNEEKLKKSSILVKLGAIPFWIMSLIVLKKENVSGKDLFFALLFLFIMLLGTSVYVIASIRLLYKEKKLRSAQMVIHTVLQFFFVLDIISVFCLNKDFARLLFGSYKPPEYVVLFANAVKRIAVKIGGFFTGQWRSHRIRLCLIITALCLIPAGLRVSIFIESHKPQPISIDFNVTVPRTTGDPDNRSSLSVNFRGSAATLEMKDKEVPPGNISINPPINGVWRWY